MFPDSRLAGLLGQKHTLSLGGVYGCSAAMIIAQRMNHEPGPQLVLTDSVARAESLAGEISTFTDARIAAPTIFPDLEVLPYDSFSPHQDIVAARLTVLRDLIDATPLTLIAAVTTLMHTLPPRDFIGGRALRVRRGQTLQRDELQQRLDDAGYLRVSQVATPGEFAPRGSLLDFFPTGHGRPVRIDFFDDEVDSMREFDPDTQLTKRQIDQVDTLPAREYPLDANGIQRFRRRFRQRFEGNPASQEVYRDVSEGRPSAGIEAFLPLFFDATAALWDYLPDGTAVTTVGDVEDAAIAAWQRIEQRYAQAEVGEDRLLLEPNELFIPPETHAAELQRRGNLALNTRELTDVSPDDGGLNLNVKAPPSRLIERRAADATARLVDFVEKQSGRVLLATESEGQRETLIDLMRPAGLTIARVGNWSEFAHSPAKVAALIAPLDAGAVLPDQALVILTERELFGERARQRRRQRRVKDPEALVRDLTDLRAGSPVVHTQHGIGRYLGLTRLDNDEARTEFALLEYAGGDRLYVPVSALHLLSRYTGATPDQAPLHRLGSGQWERAQRKAAEKIRDAAAELLDLYARREARSGTAIDADIVELEQFAAGFPFAPTHDQERAIDDVLADLRSANPMDRLVCGDVGFGKTEVALRAAFAVASTGRQVAILVPTTLLAQQHHQTFSNRFANWPVSVDVLSRFKSAAEARDVVARLADGRIDIVIGTHRLLQNEISFKNLGLVIIDEEQRFGVRHKERLKSLRSEVDVLTLTATPIPRTLNMALGGLRELSLITTPPESRLAIKTFVTIWNDAVVREACLREMGRGGQVYFVHNRIEDIEQIAEKIRERVPEARLEIAHGRMRETELERIMLDFYHRRFQILVCTAIIESGLDVPTANTIIVNRADRFGLSQLHQLRGRVGRSHHQAFAYLIAPPPREMTADAQKRLDALESLEDLGAGFILATHDLEIRGAGELLGEDQSGQIQEIGFALYNELLGRTVAALRSGREPELDTELNAGPEIDLHCAALLPDDYMPDVHLRLVHYKRIASADSEAALQALQVELIDRFGLLPPATKNLFRLSELRLLAQPCGIARIDLGPTGGQVEFGDDANIDTIALVGLVEQQPEMYRIDRSQRLRVSFDLPDPEERCTLTRELINRLTPAQAQPSNAKVRSA